MAIVFCSPYRNIGEIQVLQQMPNNFDLDDDSRAVIKAEHTIWEGWRNRDLQDVNKKPYTFYWYFPRISPSQYAHTAHIIYRKARVILAQKTLADGLFSEVFPQYLANH